ncbi:complement regulator-acquiring protein [Borreliella lusitaniae]|uniref:Complement regulator-acquiring protein n=1 Tax=Borreliella lusitaniae TaxID=100177 RepID=A0ABZ0CIY9_9SPIR|nr:complement regulator-acquiring protein [Borreliella lusitaniae]WNY69174.1 complement regulator-acquiring protein [Borreliella lusitaniae]
MKKNDLILANIIIKTLLLCSCSLFQGTITQRISTEIKKFKEKVEQYKDQIEDSDQFGMKYSVFNADTTALQLAKLNSDSKKDERRLFYSSLDYNKEKIVNFGKILTQLYKQQKQQYHQLIEEVVKTGFSIQKQIEETILKVSQDADELKRLGKENLKTLETATKELFEIKQNWIKKVDEIILSYNQNSEKIKEDAQKLAEHIKYKIKKEQYDTTAATKKIKEILNPYYNLPSLKILENKI